MLRKLYAVKKNEIKICMAMLIAVFIVGIIAEYILHINNKNEEVASILLIAAMLWRQAFGISTEKTDYNLSISMGNTRKNYIISEILSIMLEAVFLVLLVCSAHIIHLKIMGLNITEEIRKIFKIEYLILGLIMYTAIILFYKFIIIRFEKKAIIGMWVLYVVIIMVIPKISRIRDEKSNSKIAEYIRKFTGILSGINKNEWFIIGLAVSVILLLLSGYFGMKTEISN